MKTNKSGDLRNGVKDCDLRKGDIVREKGRGGRLGVVFETWAWFLIEGHIDVRFKDNHGLGSIVDIKDIRLVERREKIKKWWDYIY